FFFFFFSSRRRHTRFSRDWSSDVCSSDLEIYARRHFGHHFFGGQFHFDRGCLFSFDRRRHFARVTRDIFHPLELIGAEEEGEHRSEERRVGKEGRARWSAYH